LLFRRYCRLVGDKKIGVVSIYLAKTFGSQLSVNGLFDLLVHKIIHRSRIFESHPFVGFELREISVLVEVVSDVLTEGMNPDQKQERYKDKRNSFHVQPR